MGYLYLIVTVFLEAIGIALLNKSNGVSHLKFLVLGLIFLNLGMMSFAFALKTLNMPTANAAWSGLSILLVAIIGHFYFFEKYTLSQCIFIFMIVLGLVVLSLSGFSK